MNRHAPGDAGADRAFDDVAFPAEWNVTDEGERRLLRERLAEYDRSGLFYTLDDVRGWLAARRLDADAPLPPPRCKSG